MHTEKAFWNTTNDQFTLTMPITKIDKENRIVSGFGTLNNVDLQKDVVDAEASRKAFKEWAGNVRMMHDRVPAGKAIDFMEKSITDGDKEYEGMYVDVYISKGAPNVWEMVLDETLKGFSIGGRVNDYVMKEIDGETVRVITDYTLTELSLVDVPANHMAKIMSIQKSIDGAVQISSIYDDKTSESSVILKEEETMMSLLNKIWATVNKLTKGGSEEVTDIEKAIVQPDTASVVQPDVRKEQPTPVEDAAETKDEEVKSTEDSAATDKVKEVASGTANKEFAKQLESLNSNLVVVAGIVEKLAERIAGLEKADNNQQVTKALDEIVGRLKAVESDTAAKQSADIAKSTVVMPQKQKSIWDGAILKTSDF